MNHRIAIWNTLHDGEITVAAREDTALIIFVNIPYIRGRLTPIGDSFSLRLNGFRFIEFVNYQCGSKTSSISEIAMSGIEILSTDSTSMPVKIATTQGFLTLDFEDLEIRLDTGPEVDYETVLAACVFYWDNWENDAKSAKDD